MTQSKPNDLDSRFACGVVLQLLKSSPSHEINIGQAIQELRQAAGGTNAGKKAIEACLRDAISLLDPLVSSADSKLRLVNTGCPSVQKCVSFFDKRKGMDAREKQAVAAYIHDEILNELDAIFMDAGSACEAIAWEMALGNKGHFTVMTNNMRSVRAFLTRPGIRIRITGGTYVVDDEALVGGGAVFDPEEYSVKYAIVGASGITATHVYNHGITGEEFIKGVYWQTPAELLIVPATLRKFGGKDACCFGELFKEKEQKEFQTKDGTVNVYDVLHNTIEEVRFSSRRTSRGFSLHRDVPKFTASKCKIIIGPKWLISETYKETAALEQVVDEINCSTHTSCVEVIHADISRERLEESMRRISAVAGK